MSVMLQDIYEEIDRSAVQNIVEGTDFDEIMYIDNTIYISTDTRTMNIMVDKIIEGRQYGMKLYYKKCELLTSEEP